MVPLTRQEEERSLFFPFFSPLSQIKFLAGMLGTVAMNPIDIVKVIMEYYFLSAVLCVAEQVSYEGLYLNRVHHSFIQGLFVGVFMVRGSIFMTYHMY